ncbi:PREDICTED: uncharacterized protein LOC107126105, partial [Gekko japonicus]|uniref:ribonuclease H n=1 Tax=Gekko japonicus TaxID=146911 RepID=A0ABM1LGL6_GEKJA
MLDTGAEVSIVTTPIAPPTKDSLTVVGMAGKKLALPYLQSRTCSLGGHRVTHRFLLNPSCPINLLGRDLLSKMRASITFDTPDGSALLSLPPETQTSLVCCNLEVDATEEWRLPEVLMGCGFRRHPDGDPEEVQYQTDKDAFYDKEKVQDKLYYRNEVPTVWAEDNPPGFAKHQPPVVVVLKPTANPVRERQYPIREDARRVLTKHFQRLLKDGILIPCESAWNTPILPVPKPSPDPKNPDYRPVQDLRAVNTQVEAIHPVVPNPYTILTLIPSTAAWFTVLDLKDAFFSIGLHHQSRDIFAFEWRAPGASSPCQYTWTRLPQGYKNSPSLFGQALGKDLENFDTQEGVLTLIQYVDDLLLCAPDPHRCSQGTLNLLRLLDACGYKVSFKKAQICLTRVQFLGFEISKNQRSLSNARKETVCQIPLPQSRKELRGFLGAASYCRLWIPSFALLAKPLYEATKGGTQEPFVWGPDQDVAFRTLKQRLIEAPALGLPDPEKPFSLCVDEKQSVALGVLLQKLGTHNRPVAYLSQNLDAVEAGLPPCLRAVAACCRLIEAANKFTWGAPLTVFVSHGVKTILEARGHKYLTVSRMARYQAVLLENPGVSLAPVININPATLLPVPCEDVEHDCLVTTDQLFASRLDLRDQPLQQPDLILYCDGSSFINPQGRRKAGYAVVDDHQVIQAESLPVGTSAQLAEIIALTVALHLSKNAAANIFTDSMFAFKAAHAHGMLWQHRGFITAAGKDIKYGPNLRLLLEAINLPTKIAIIHCRGHQRKSDPIAEGNGRADKAAKEAAEGKLCLRTLVPSPSVLACPVFPTPVSAWTPRYTKHEDYLCDQQSAKKNEEGWWILPTGKIWIPASLGYEIMKALHANTHYGSSSLVKALDRWAHLERKTALADLVCRQCVTCARNNPREGPRRPPGINTPGPAPMTSLVVDFTEMPKVGRHHYLLVFVCTHTGWIEAFPTATEKASEVARAMLRDLIPRFGLPTWVSSDNGPAFISELTQQVAKALGIIWKLHCAYRPQSSGAVERANRTLKASLRKFTQETEQPWPKILPLVLFRLHCLPSKRTSVSPYEAMFGRPPPLTMGVHTDAYGFHQLITSAELQALGRQVEKLQRHYSACLPVPLFDSVCHVSPGDSVWVKNWRPEPLGPRWEGPFTVLLS